MKHYPPISKMLYFCAALLLSGTALYASPPTHANAMTVREEGIGGLECTHAEDGIQNPELSKEAFEQACNSTFVEGNANFGCPYDGGFKCGGTADTNGTTPATPTVDTPTNDTPTNDTPTNDTPTNDTPTNDTPTNDTPSAGDSELVDGDCTHAEDGIQNAELSQEAFEQACNSTFVTGNPDFSCPYYDGGFKCQGPANTNGTNPEDDNPSTGDDQPQGEAAIRNTTHEQFTRHSDVAYGEGGFADGSFFQDLTRPATEGVSGGPTFRPNDAEPGRYGDGNFRVLCQYSHFAYNDPIRSPGAEGQSHHLHMFFGNTETDSNSTGSSLAASGGGTCQGFALNRSAYWTPALMSEDDKAIIPTSIVAYYKDAGLDAEGNPLAVEEMDQGLTLVGGTLIDDDPSASSFTTFWSCGRNGTIQDKSGTIPQCDSGEQLNATVYFPQCVNALDSGAGSSHLHLLENVTDACPAGYERVPQLGLLIYWDVDSLPDGELRLSSDEQGDPRGSTLHADWIGAWHQPTMNTWMNECIRALQNCSSGQTGTPRQLDRVRANGVFDSWTGPTLVTPPAQNGAAARPSG